MERKAVSGIMLTLLLVGMLASVILFSFLVRVDAYEEWVPYIPHAKDIEFDYWKENGTSYMDISIMFPSSGYNVSDWGTPGIIGNNVSVDAVIWQWTGWVYPWVIYESHTYSLGNLSSGEYLFTFKAWGVPVKNTTFTVLIIVPDDYPTIQEAINNANSGDTIYVRAGTYYENVVVDRRVSLVGENRNTTIIDGGGTQTVVYVTAQNVSITRFTIQNGGSSYEDCCILLNGTFGVTLALNKVLNSHHGIYLYHSSCNYITSNTMSNNVWGMYLNASSKNTLKTNYLSSNRYNFYVCSDAGMSSHFIQDIDSSNMVDGKPIHYWMNQHDKEISTDAGLVVIVNSTKISVKDLTLANNGEGVLFINTTDSTIENVTASNNYVALSLGWSSDNMVKNNNIISNDYGFTAYRSTNNTVISNVISRSDVFGIMIYVSSGNTVYHNNLIGNRRQVYSFYSSNTWDNGCEGNYWSDYTGTDSDGDGIGDTPYVIDGNNQDNFPLMAPFLVGDVNHDGIVDASDLFDLSKVYGSKPGDENWNCHCDFNEDNKVDASDLFDLSKNYGKTI